MLCLVCCVDVLSETKETCLLVDAVSCVLCRCVKRDKGDVSVS